MNNIFYLLLKRTDLLTDHAEMMSAYLYAIILFVAAIAFFVCGMFVLKKLFFTLSLLSFVGYFYLNINYLNVEFLWLIVTMMGVIMMILEVLVPGIQFFALVGALFLAIGFANSTGSITESIIVIGISILMSMALVYIFTKKGYRIKAFDKFVLQDEITSKATDDEGVVGKIAHTVTALKPTGKGVIDDVTYDLYSNEGYIPQDTDVKIIKEEGSKIIVRRIK